jgi:phosphate transport system ATP-binding protein
MQNNKASIVKDSDIAPGTSGDPCESALCIRRLQVYAGRLQILKDVHLDIPKNRITVLLGPSGCGKTTLLRCINRLTDLYKELKVSGYIMLDGDNVLEARNDIAFLRQKMGLLSQRPYPLPMSVYKNVAYGIRLKGVRDKKLVDYAVEKNLKEAGLWEEVKDRLKKPANTLSIGQQQRLCLSRGLAVKPLIILADEPTSALDPVSSKIIEDLFRKLKENYTIILVTHVLRQAVRMADKVVFMSDGQIIEQGEPAMLLKNPQSLKLKEYLKDGN